MALTSSISDFEDAVQHAAAQLAGLSAIVTRSIKDFSTATLAVFTPSDFIAHLSP